MDGLISAAADVLEVSDSAHPRLSVPALRIPSSARECASARVCECVCDLAVMEEEKTLLLAVGFLSCEGDVFLLLLERLLTPLLHYLYHFTQLCNLIGPSSSNPLSLLW